WTAEWGSPRFRWAAPFLLDPLLGDERADRRELKLRAAVLLGGIGDPAAAAPLASLARSLSSSEPDRRLLLRNVLLALGRIAAAADAAARGEIGAAVAAHLETAIDEDVLAAAAEAAGLAGHAPSRGALVALMNRAALPEASWKAAEALGRMRAADCLEGRDAEGNLRVLPLLASCLETPRLGFLALHLVRALRAIGVRSPAVVDHLVLAVGRGDPAVCREAMDVAGREWREPAAWDAIRRVFDDAAGRAYALRLVALDVLASYPPELSAGFLLTLVPLPRAGDRKGAGRAAAVREAEAFARIAVRYFDRPGRLGPGHRGALLAIAADPEAANRPHAVRWLSRKGIWAAPECVDGLLDCFRSGDPEVRGAAREAFLAHPSAAAMGALVRANRRSDPGRFDAADLERSNVIGAYVAAQDRVDKRFLPNPQDGPRMEAWYKRHEGEFGWPADR
ncbi:MAG: hypothetical protein MUC63_08225, partial [Planctomycetes bacterium]|nr:hypothetical protein [Planctomycetota bacterium]